MSPHAHAVAAPLQRGRPRADTDVMATAIADGTVAAPGTPARGGLWPLVTRYPAGTTLVVGLALTSLVALLPELRFAYENSQGRMALETTAALIGLFTVVLLVARFYASNTIADLGLAGGLAVLVVANLSYSVIPLAA